MVTEAKQAYGLVRDGKGWQDCLEGLMDVLPQEVKSRIEVSDGCRAGPSRLCPTISAALCRQLLWTGRLPLRCWWTPTPGTSWQMPKCTLRQKMSSL